MAKNRRVAFYLEEEWLKALTGLAGTFGVSAQEVIRRSLPDVAVSELFFRCKIFSPELRWDEVSDAGQAAIREYLRATYMKGLEEHLARLGASLQSSADEVEAASSTPSTRCERIRLTHSITRSPRPRTIRSTWAACTTPGNERRPARPNTR
jgi:hypothetical protein